MYGLPYSCVVTRYSLKLNDDRIIQRPKSSQFRTSDFSVNSNIVLGACLVMENVFRCVIVCILWQSTAEDEWNSKDYLKREFSLVKPYSGF